jgi:SAM-dependent methyltransferase
MCANAACYIGMNHLLREHYTMLLSYQVRDRASALKDTRPAFRRPPGICRLRSREPKPSLLPVSLFLRYNGARELKSMRGIVAVAQPEYQAGGHDWLAIWRQMYDDERAQAESTLVPGFVPQPDCWANQADRFAAAAQRGAQPDGFMRLLLPRLRPTDRVIDIGAGTGRYEPLLAAHAAEVLAIEPSPSMRGQLERRLSEMPATNVRVSTVGWPPADLPICDVAIAAHVLYAVREIEPFLRGMYAAARHAGYLLLAFRHPSSFISPFWERLHGARRLPLPGALECLNALYQLGIAAHLTPVPIVNRFGYADEGEALADLRWRLRVPAQLDYDRAISAALRDLLDRGEDGRLAPRNQPEYAAAIWWEHPQQPAD